MAVTLQSLGIDQLTREEQFTLLHDLWDHLAQQEAVPLISEEMKAEFDRRLAQADAHPESLIPWSEVKKAALERIKSCWTEQPDRNRQNQACKA